MYNINCFKINEYGRILFMTEYEEPEIIINAYGEEEPPISGPKRIHNPANGTIILEQSISFESEKEYYDFIDFKYYDFNTDSFVEQSPANYSFSCDPNIEQNFSIPPEEWPNDIPYSEDILTGGGYGAIGLSQTIFDEDEQRLVRVELPNIEGVLDNIPADPRLNSLHFTCGKDETFIISNVIDHPDLIINVVGYPQVSEEILANSVFQDTENNQLILTPFNTSNNDIVSLTVVLDHPYTYTTEIDVLFGDIQLSTDG